nr:AAA family ATPase [Morganella morganii]
MRKGSDGFDTRQDYLIKGYLPGSSVASAYGATLARCFGGSDENAAKDMGAFIQGCDFIKAATQATVLVIHHSGKDQDKGARGSSAFRAALDVEFHVRREGEDPAIILSCTKMKDAEEPPRKAYDLHSVDLYVDEDGDQITSLVLNDEGREARDDDPASDPDLAGVPRLTDNHVALWQAIRSRTAKGESCTRAVLRDDMKAMNFDVSKKFSRWLDKLEKDNLIAFRGEEIIPLPHQTKVGD